MIRRFGILPVMFFFGPDNQLNQDLAALDQSVLDSAEAVHVAAKVLRREYDEFWGNKTPERLLAILNYNVPKMLAIFEANTAIGTAINARLDEVSASLREAGRPDPFHHRAPVSMPAGFGFNPAVMQFTYAAA